MDKIIKKNLPYDSGLFQIKPLVWDKESHEAIGINHSYAIVPNPEKPFSVVVKYFSYREQKGGVAPGFNHIYQAQRWANDHNRLKAMPFLEPIVL